jgi:L-lactate dehydrogenase complex protein LldG
VVIGMSNKRGTIVGREDFMEEVAARLGRSGVAAEPPEHPVRGVPEHYKAIRLPEDEKIRLFAENWTALSGKILIVKKEDAKETILRYLLEVAAELGIRSIARWDHDLLKALELEDGLHAAGIEVVPWKEADHEEPIDSAEDSNWAKRSRLLRSVERCDMGIVWPDYAIANTSTLVLLARGGKGRSVSLLPGSLLAIFHADQLVTRMGEALTALREAYPEVQDLPSSINMVTGPSRSADIENDLTIGVHGPGKVYAVIIA